MQTVNLSLFSSNIFNFQNIRHTVQLETDNSFTYILCTRVCCIVYIVKEFQQAKLAYTWVLSEELAYRFTQNHANYNLRQNSIYSGKSWKKDIHIEGEGAVYVFLFYPPSLSNYAQSYKSVTEIYQYKHVYCVYSVWYYTLYIHMDMDMYGWMDISILYDNSISYNSS